MMTRRISLNRRELTYTRHASVIDSVIRYRTDPGLASQQAMIVVARRSSSMSEGAR